MDVKKRHSYFFYFITTLGFVCLVAFQNCSKVDFARIPVATNSINTPGYNFEVDLHNGNGDFIHTGHSTCTPGATQAEAQHLEFTLTIDQPLYHFYIRRVAPDNELTYEMLTDGSPVAPISSGQNPGTFVISLGDPNSGLLTFDDVDLGVYQLLFYADYYEPGSEIASTAVIPYNIHVDDCSAPPTTVTSTTTSSTTTTGVTVTSSTTTTSGTGSSSSSSSSSTSSSTTTTQTTTTVAPSTSTTTHTTTTQIVTTTQPTTTTHTTTTVAPTTSTTTRTTTTRTTTTTHIILTTTTTTRTTSTTSTTTPPPGPGTFTITGVRGFTTDDVYDTLIWNPSSGEEGAWSAATGATSYQFQVLNATGSTPRCSGTSSGLTADIDVACGVLPDGTYRLAVTAVNLNGTRAASNSPYTFYVKTPSLSAIFGLRSDLTWLPPQSNKSFTFKPTIINASPYAVTDIEISTSNYRDQTHTSGYRNFVGVIPKAPASAITSATPTTSEPLFQWTDTMSMPIGCGTQGYIFARYYSTTAIDFTGMSNNPMAGHGTDVQPGAGPCIDNNRPNGTLTSSTNGLFKGTGSDADLPTTPTAIGVYLRGFGDSSGWGGGHLMWWARTNEGTGIAPYGKWSFDLHAITTVNSVWVPAENPFVGWYNSQTTAVKNQVLPLCNGIPKTYDLWVVNVPSSGAGGDPGPSNRKFVDSITINCN